MPALTSLEKVRRAFVHHGWEITEEEEVIVEVSDRDRVVQANWGGRVRRYGKKKVPGIKIVAFNGCTDERPGMNTRLRAEFELETGRYIDGGSGTRGRGLNFTWLMEHIESDSLVAYEERQEQYAERRRSRIAEEAPLVAAEYERMKIEEAKELAGVLDIVSAEVRKAMLGREADVLVSQIVERLDKSGAVDEWARARGRSEAAGRGTFFGVGDYHTSQARYGRYEKGVPIDEG